MKITIQDRYDQVYTVDSFSFATLIPTLDGKTYGKHPEVEMLNNKATA